jgi:anti-sigma B factor antagonist
MPLDISHQQMDGGIILIKISGKVMLGPESQRLETLTADLLNQGHRKFIFDMAGITHIDSTGIGRFISALNKVMQAGGRMHMAGATGAVREGFRVTRLDTVFKFYETIDEAGRGLA